MATATFFAACDKLGERLASLFNAAAGVRSKQVPKAYWSGKVIAESDACVVVEGNQYFPVDSVKREYLRPSSHTTMCPWKGTAHYFHLEVDGMKNENAAWYYPEPSDAAKQIRGRIAFWKGVRVEA